MRAGPRSDAPRASPTSSPYVPGAARKPSGSSRTTTRCRGPRRGDDALGVACRSRPRACSRRGPNRNWTLMVLVTDGEEAGLMGAAALMTDRDVTDRLQAYINLEAIGSARAADAVRGWARQRVAARAAGRATRRIREADRSAPKSTRLPNDTDFSILKLHEIPGLNFAAVGDSYAYHTARDTPERLSPSPCAQTGEQVVAIVTALDGVDITQRSRGDRTFFDVAAATALSYGADAGIAIAVAALVLGVDRVGQSRRGGWQVRHGRSALAVRVHLDRRSARQLVVASMIGATWALRAAREVYHPWYARPGRLFLFSLAVGMTVGWGVARVGRWLPERVRGMRHPWSRGASRCRSWIALSGWRCGSRPGLRISGCCRCSSPASLLASLPVGSEAAVRIASVVVLAAGDALAAADTSICCASSSRCSAACRIVTPVFVYAAIMRARGHDGRAAARRHADAEPAPAPSVADDGVLLLAVGGLRGLGVRRSGVHARRAAARVTCASCRKPARAAVWEVGSVEPGSIWATARRRAGSRRPDRRRRQRPACGNCRTRSCFARRGSALGPAPIGIASLRRRAGGGRHRALGHASCRVNRASCSRSCSPRASSRRASSLPGVHPTRALDGDVRRAAG